MALNGRSWWLRRVGGSVGERLRAMAGRDGAGAVFEPMEARQMLAAAPVVVGGNIQVNSYTTGSRFGPSVGVSGDGSFVAVWDGEGTGDTQGIFAQRYNSSGSAVGGNFLVNTYTTGTQGGALVGVAGDGSFVVAWSGVSPGTNWDWDIYAQRYDSKGVAVGSNFVVYASTTERARLLSMDVGADGAFSVVWLSDLNGGPAPVMAQAFNASGAAVGGNIVVQTGASPSTMNADVDMAPDGTFVIAWPRVDGTGGVLAQRYSSTGGLLGGNIVVSDYAWGNHPDVDFGGDGSFVITWDGKESSKDTTLDVLAQRFDGAGNALGKNLRLLEDEAFVKVAAGGDGSFVVTWYESGAGETRGLFAWAFDTDGMPIGDAFKVTTRPAVEQLPLGIDIGSDGSMVIGWWDKAAEPVLSETGVFVQRFSFNSPVRVVGHIADVYAAKDAADTQIGLTGYFADPDQAASSLAYTVVSNDNTSVVTTKIASGVLTLDYVAGMTGTAEIVVRATDKAGLYAQEVFYVTVSTVSDGFGRPTVTSMVSGDGIDSLGSVQVTFSSTINVATFGWSDLMLTRDSGVNLIGPGSGVTMTLDAGKTYTIAGLAGLTHHVGNYTLTIKDASVANESGGLLYGRASTTFNIGTLAASKPLLTDASEGKAGSMQTNQTQPTLEGTATPGAKVKIYEGSLIKGVGMADAWGHYSITLQTLGNGLHWVQAVASSPSNTAAGSELSRVSVNTTVPTFVSISSFPALRTAPVLTVAVRVSASPDMGTFDWQDLTLTRNGGANMATSGISIAQSTYDTGVYTITMPALMVSHVGSYALSVNGAGVQNYAGSAFNNSLSTAWTIIADTPGAPVLAVGSEGKAGSGYTQYPTPTVTGTGSAGSTVDVYEGATLKGSGVVGSDGKYNVTLSALAPGVHTLKARATDGMGTVTGYSAEAMITVETATPTIVSMSTYAAPRTVPVGSTGIRFSSVIDLSTFSVADMTLTRNGVPVPTTGITVTVSPTDNKLYTIVIPPGLNTPDGVYVLEVNGAGIKNLAGKTVGNTLSTTWTMLPQIISMSQYPSARVTPVTAPGIRFSNPVNLSTFTWADITLKRNGGANLVTGTSGIWIVVSASDPSVYTIVLPSALTSAPGTYVLTVAGAGIQSVNGYTVSNSMSTTWTQI